MSATHPDWEETVNLNLLGHEERLNVIEAYPERNDKRVGDLEEEVRKLREELQQTLAALVAANNKLHERMDYCDVLLHRYINQDAPQ